MPMHWVGILAGAAFGFVVGALVGDAFLAWRLRRITKHWPDRLAQAAEAAAYVSLQPGGFPDILRERIDQLAADFEVVAHLIGIERE